MLLYPEFVGFHLFIYFPNTVVFFSNAFFQKPTMVLPKPKTLVAF